MRESFLEIKIVLLVVVLLAGSRLAIGQEKSKKQVEWEATALAKMSDDDKRNMRY
jgi:hypothetical protein